MLIVSFFKKQMLPTSPNIAKKWQKWFTTPNYCFPTYNHIQPAILPTILLPIPIANRFISVPFSVWMILCTVHKIDRQFFNNCCGINLREFKIPVAAPVQYRNVLEKSKGKFSTINTIYVDLQKIKAFFDINLNKALTEMSVTVWDRIRNVAFLLLFNKCILFSL